MDLEISCKNNILHVRVTGEFILAEANNSVITIFEALIRHGLKRVFVDCRGLEGEPTTMERFLHATFTVSAMNRFADAGVSRGTRFGYVGREPLIDEERFGETVAVNRGLNVKVSLSEQDVLGWLAFNLSGGS